MTKTYQLPCLLLLSAIKFSVAVLPSSMMQTGTIDPRFTSPTQNKYDVIPTKKIVLSANTGWNISWDHYTGQSGNYVTLTKKNEKIGLAIVRPYRLEEKEQTFYADDEYFSRKLGKPVTILEMTPVIVDNGRYAIIWVKDNNQEKPVRVNFNPSDITFSFVNNPSNLSSFTKKLAGSLEHPYLLGTIYTESEGHLFYSLNAKTNIIQPIAPKDSRKWKFVDGMQVAPNGQNACAIVRENSPSETKSSDQISLGMIFNNNKFWIQDSQLIKKYIDDKSLIKDFQIDNRMNLLDNISKNGNIDLYDSATQHTPRIPFQINGVNYTINPPVIFEKAEPIFTTTVLPPGLPFNPGLYLIIYDKIVTESNIPSLKNIIYLKDIDQALLNDADIEISPPKKYSDRHFMFELKFIPNATRFDDLSEQEKKEQYKQIEPNFVVIVDILDLTTMVVELKNFKLFFVSANDELKLQKAFDDTLIFTNPKDSIPTLYFHRLPSINKTGFDLNKAKQEVVGDSNVINSAKHYFKAIGIKGQTVVGNYSLKPSYPSGETRVSFSYTKFLEEQKKFKDIAPDSVPKSYLIEGASENLQTSAGSGSFVHINKNELNQGIPCPTIMITENATSLLLSTNPGIARHCTDNADTVVGNSFDLKFASHPTIWTKSSPDKKIPDQVEVDGAVGEYNCVDRTGTWAAGSHTLADGNHAIVKNIKTNISAIDLGRGTIYEMTWDGSVICGEKIKDGKSYACLWKRTKDNTWIEKIIEGSEGLEPYQAYIDHQTGKYITFKSKGKFYFWSDKLGVIPFEQLLQQQCCYYISSATSDTSRSTTIPEIEFLGRCDGKNILFKGTGGDSYTILLKDLSAITSEDTGVEGLTTDIQKNL